MLKGISSYSCKVIPCEITPIQQLFVTVLLSSYESQSGMYLGSREAKLSQVFAACLKPPAVQISIAEPPDLQRRIWSRFVGVRCFSERRPIGARSSASKWDTPRSGESHPPTSTGTSITYDPHMIPLPLAWGQTFTGSHAIYNHGEKSDASIAGCGKFSRINMNSPPKLQFS